MKKLLTIITIVSLLTLTLASFAFAADKDETPQWFKDMISWKKDQINKAVENGNLTKDQAKAWNDHFDYMEKWHTENGFTAGGMGFGGCHGRFANKGGYGPSMMDGYGLQNQ